MNQQLPTPISDSPDDFAEYYYVTLYNLERDGDCEGLEAFLGKDGAGRTRRNKAEDNYDNASKLYHLALECAAENPDSKILDSIVLPIQPRTISRLHAFQ
jgi:hypothetical protein